MSILAIEHVQAHLDDLQREAAQRRVVAAARRASQHDADVPAAPVRAYYQVRRVLGAHR
jgi:hypothetical protein